jgi:hypothetical protein
MRKTWKQKLDNGREPVVVDLRTPVRGMPAGTKLLVGTPRMVKEYIERIPPGNTVSVQRLRDDLGALWDADTSCPLVTGIFLRIVSEAALEELAGGTPVDRITPFWRVVDENSPTAKKINGGRDFIRRMREREGIAPHQTGGRPAPAKLGQYRYASVRS